MGIAAMSKSPKGCDQIRLNRRQDAAAQLPWSPWGTARCNSTMATSDRSWASRITSSNNVEPDEEALEMDAADPSMLTTESDGLAVVVESFRCN